MVGRTDTWMDTPILISPVFLQKPGDNKLCTYRLYKNNLSTSDFQRWMIAFINRERTL